VSADKKENEMNNAIDDSFDLVCSRFEQHYPLLANLDVPSHVDSLKFFTARAGVLVPLVQRANGEWFVLLTKRSSSLRTNPGDVALPGGKANPRESSLDAALREANEEIGLSDVTVIGRVEVFTSRTGIGVTPYVVVVDERTFRPSLNAAEVDSLFAAPMSLFLNGLLRSDESKETWRLTFDIDTVPIAVASPSTPLSVESCRVYGLTAFILLRVLSIMAPSPCRRLISRERWDELEFFIEQTRVRVREEIEAAQQL
jgi:8-oxo-dGTP pyrophosphatase MutT (NUDIX family)